VLDFGIAELLADGDRTVTHLTVAGRSPFSPAFASPEQLRGLTLTPATDVFSLAAVGFQLLTGKRAFGSTDPQRMLVELSGALAAELPRVRGLAPEARDVLRRALAPDARDRFPDAAVLAEALAPFVRAPRPRVADAEEDERTVFLPANRAAASAPAVAPEQRGWLSRAGRAAWNLTLTTTCVTLFAGSWLATFGALDHGLLQRIYAATTLSVLLAPLAVHRLLGGRGSFRFALLGSIAGSVAAVYLLARHGSIETVLTGVLAAQLVASYAGERLTRREESR
jgi:hypothetical protein